jgi:hypothetical protein
VDRTQWRAWACLLEAATRFAQTALAFLKGR